MVTFTSAVHSTSDKMIIFLEWVAAAIVGIVLDRSVEKYLKNRKS